MTDRPDRDGEDQFLRSTLESVDGEHPPSPDALARMESAMLDAYETERAEAGSAGGTGLPWGRVALVAACVVTLFGLGFALRTLDSDTTGSAATTVPEATSFDDWCREELAGLAPVVPAAVTEDALHEDVEIALDEFALILRRIDLIPNTTVEQREALRSEYTKRLASVTADLILDSESEEGRQAATDLLVGFGNALIELGGSTEACLLVGS